MVVSGTIFRFDFRVCMLAYIAIVGPWSPLRGRLPVPSRGIHTKGAGALTDALAYTGTCIGEWAIHQAIIGIATK